MHGAQLFLKKNKNLQSQIFAAAFRHFKGLEKRERRPALTGEKSAARGAFPEKVMGSSELQEVDPGAGRHQSTVLVPAQHAHQRRTLVFEKKKFKKSVEEQEFKILTYSSVKLQREIASMTIT
jgi:hypothetical protein